MKWILFCLLLSNISYSQESKFRLIREIQVNDSTILQTAELMIFNNSSKPICIEISHSFLSHILSSDFVNLPPLNSASGCPHYDLLVGEGNVELGTNDIPRYPIVLFNRTCFVATVSYLKKPGCDQSWIEYRYYNDPEIDYYAIIKKAANFITWYDEVAKYKRHTAKIYLP